MSNYIQPHRICDAICCAQGHEGQRCTAKAEYQHNGYNVCWVHRCAMGNPIRRRPVEFFKKANP